LIFIEIKKKYTAHLFFVDRGADIFPQYVPTAVSIKGETAGTQFLVITMKVSQGGGLR
jgi:hypothetical protein